MGRKGSTRASGSQGSLQQRRRALEDARMVKELETVELREVTRLAREYTRLAVQALAGTLVFARSEAARVAAARVLLEHGWGKPAVHKDADAGRRGGGPGTVTINVMNLNNGTAEQVEAPAIEVKALPDATVPEDLPLDADFRAPDGSPLEVAR